MHRWRIFMCYFQGIHIVKMKAEGRTLLKHKFHDIFNQYKKNVKDIIFKRPNNYQQKIKLTIEMSLLKFLYTTLNHGTIIPTGIKSM